MAVLYVIKQLSQQAVSTEVLKYVKNTGDSCLAVVAVLVLCMTVRLSFFSFHFISFHLSFWRLGVIIWKNRVIKVYRSILPRFVQYCRPD